MYSHTQTYIHYSTGVSAGVSARKNPWSNVGGLTLEWSLESQNTLMKQSTKNMTCDHTHVIMGIWYG